MRFLALSLFVPLLALGNDTAINDGGDGPEPLGGTAGPESVIRMVRERLVIAVGREKTDVQATFVFLNTKTDTSAKQTVGFPDSDATAAGNEELGDVNGPIENLKTLVDGKERQSRKLRRWVRLSQGVDQLATRGDEGAFERIWHAIDVEFPVGKEVVIERRYQVSNGSSVSDPARTTFDYTTATGGVWKGDIGHMTAEVTLKDGLTADRLLWSKNGTSPGKKEWKIVSPTSMRLEWSNFEPRTDPSKRGFRIAFPMAGEQKN